jgi:hypothetical protein
MLYVIAYDSENKIISAKQLIVNLNRWTEISTSKTNPAKLS